MEKFTRRQSAGNLSHNGTNQKSSHQRTLSWNLDKINDKDEITLDLHQVIDKEEESKQNENHSKQSDIVILPKIESHSPRKLLLRVKSRSHNPSPRRGSVINDEHNSKSVDHTPNGSPRLLLSQKSSPLAKSSSTSPRKSFNQIVSKIKTGDLDDKDNREKKMFKDKNKFGNSFYENTKYKLSGDTYEITFYATSGDINKLKEIIEHKNYTQDDLIVAIEAARKCGHYDVSKYLEELQDFF